MFLFFNWWRFGDPFDIGYPRVPQSYPLLDGLHGLFLSPGKSLFLFAPLTVLGAIGLLLGSRRQPLTMVLLGGCIVANVVLFSRVPYWAGDAAWGPRYQQIIVPLLCAPAVVLATRRWWKPVFAAAAALGLLLPSLLGSAIYFNVLFVEASNAGVSGDALTNDLAWQPFLGHLGLLDEGIRDVLGAHRPDEIDRGLYSDDSFTQYGYFAIKPRLDLWWLWVDPMDRSKLTYLFMTPIALAAAGCWSVSRGRGGSSRDGSRIVSGTRAQAALGLGG
jgi:hypothetical protein